MNKVDYLKLSEQYASFLVAAAGVSITVLTLVVTLGGESTVVDLRSFLVAALAVSTISCFIGAQMMAETAASLSYAKENPTIAIPDDSKVSRGRLPKSIPLGERLFLLASTNVFITAILLLFALMLLPIASKKVETESIRWISVWVFWFVLVCASIWMFLAVEYRMNVKGGLRVSVIAFVIGLLARLIVSYFVTSKEYLLWATFIPIGFFSAALLLRFAWLFRDSDKPPSEAYILDISFFIFFIAYSYASLAVAGMRMMYSE